MKTSFIIVFLSFFGTISLHGQSISIAGISEVKPLKRGTTYAVALNGVDDSEVLVLQLLNHQTTKVFAKWEESVSNSNVSFKIPSNIKPATGYFIKIRNPRTNTDFTTPQFRIRRKIPLGIKLLGLGLVSTATVLLLNEDEKPPLLTPAPLPERE